MLAGLFGLLPGIKWLRRKRRIRRLQTGDITAAWTEIVDHLTDLGDGPARSSTPTEFANRTDHMMRPLADVYGASVYGSGADDAGSIRLATRSLIDTEDRLRRRYSLAQRITARYKIGTLLPRWMRRRRF